MRDGVADYSCVFKHMGVWAEEMGWDDTELSKSGEYIVKKRASDSVSCFSRRSKEVYSDDDDDDDNFLLAVSDVEINNSVLHCRAHPW